MDENSKLTAGSIRKQLLGKFGQVTGIVGVLQTIHNPLAYFIAAAGYYEFLLLIEKSGWKQFVYDRDFLFHNLPFGHNGRNAGVQASDKLSESEVKLLQQILDNCDAADLFEMRHKPKFEIFLPVYKAIAHYRADYEAAKFKLLASFNSLVSRGLITPELNWLRELIEQITVDPLETKAEPEEKKLFGMIAILLYMVEPLDVVEALNKQKNDVIFRESPQKIGEVLIEQGKLTPNQVARILAIQLGDGFDWISSEDNLLRLSSFCDPSLIDASIGLLYRVVPLKLGVFPDLSLAISYDQSHYFADIVANLERLLDRKIYLVLIPPRVMDDLFKKIYCGD